MKRRFTWLVHDTAQGWRVAFVVATSIGFAVLLNPLFVEKTAPRGNKFWIGVATSAILLIVEGAIARFLFTPRVREELEFDTDSLDEAILQSNHWSYAISSNWLDLWSDRGFIKYLFLDGFKSLSIYARSYRSYNVELSDDKTEKEAFIKLSEALMAQIGGGSTPHDSHRLRLLIYPEAAYVRHQGQIKWLIELHSVDRIYCVPLVLERLVSQLSLDNRKHLVRKANEDMNQSLIDKVPSTPINRILTLLPGFRSLPIIPDMLVIGSDNLRPEWTEPSRVAWYDKNGVQFEDDADKKSEALKLFRLLCSVGSNAIWPSYTANNLGRVPIAGKRDVSQSELFFADEYYDKWLKWIDDHKDTIAEAKALDLWRVGESTALLDAVKAVGGGVNGREIVITDIGSGKGGHLIDIASRFKNVRGTGIDIIPDLVSVADNEARRRRLGDRVRFYRDDAGRLNELEDDEFDLAVCLANTFGNLDDEKQVSLLTLLHKKLHDGGMVAISVYSEESVAARLKSYAAVELQTTTDAKHIFATQGLRSQHFSQHDIVELVQNAEYGEITVKRVEAFGYFVTARKNESGPEPGPDRVSAPVEKWTTSAG